VSYRGFWFSKWLNAKPAADRKAVIDKTLKLMADGVLAPEVGECYTTCMLAVIKRDYYVAPLVYHSSLHGV